MKSIFLITALALTLLSGCCCNTYSTGCNGYSSCQCADPYCGGSGSSGSCLSNGKCCEYFGNISGARSFISDNWDSAERVESSCNGGDGCNSGRTYSYNTTSVMYK